MLVLLVITEVQLMANLLQQSWTIIVLCTSAAIGVKQLGAGNRSASVMQWLLRKSMY